jgi:hypothetical protein
MLEFAFDGVVEGTYATVESIGWQDMGLFKHMHWRVVPNGRRDKNVKAVWGRGGFHPVPIRSRIKGDLASCPSANRR